MTSCIDKPFRRSIVLACCIACHVSFALWHCRQVGMIDLLMDTYTVILHDYPCQDIVDGLQD
jgi:hypothetical protein